MNELQRKVDELIQRQGGLLAPLSRCSRRWWRRSVNSPMPCLLLRALRDMGGERET